MGRWIRNNCELWTKGTKEIETDIQKLLDLGYEFDTLNMLLEEKIKSNFNDDIDYSLKHPDNASVIIMEVFYEYLKGNFDLSVLDE